MIESYWRVVWNQFKKHPIGVTALVVLVLFALVGLYAPLLASSKPLLISYQGKLYFPLLRYLFYRGFYTKPIDLFYNVLMFTFPIGVAGFFLLKDTVRRLFLWSLLALQIGLFTLFAFGVAKDPASTPRLLEKKQKNLKRVAGFRDDPLLAPLATYPDWPFELQHMNAYAKINLILRAKQRRAQNERIKGYLPMVAEPPTLFNVDKRNIEAEKERLRELLRSIYPKYQEAQSQLPALREAYLPFSHTFLMARYALDKAEGTKGIEKAQAEFQKSVQEAAPARIPLERARAAIQTYRDALGKLNWLNDRDLWTEREEPELHVLFPALVRPFHWEDDAGGQQSSNKNLPWWELSRLNRKDLLAGLIFGVRISLVVGFSTVALALLIGIPLGMVSGYFAGKTDIIVCRWIEIWEAMPTFFMLLLIVAITQSKSIFLVVSVLGIFGWTGFSRFMRAEVLKQRGLPYVEACHSLGFGHGRVMFSHILPNAIPPILTLLPFSMMAAISSEAGLSFLGLGEESSTSWGVLMAEGRSVFPGESYLLWPPAILLTVLLVCIALVGDALRDAIDPKMRR